MVNFARHEVAFKFFEFCEDGFFLQVENFRLESLAQVEDGTTAEICEHNLADVFLADFRVGVVGPGLGKGYFKARILYLSVGNHLQFLENLHSAFVGVEDYVEVLVGAEHVGKHFAE